MRKMRQYFDKLKALKFSPLKFKKPQKSPPHQPKPAEAAPATPPNAWNASWLQRIAQGVRHFLLAVQFFTRIPLGKRLADWVGFSPEMQRSSTAYFPVVGMLVGCVVVALSIILFGTMEFNRFTPLAVAVLGVSISALLTGALHEDGLADTADGLGGYVSREKALEIMKDSRIGTYGMVTLNLVLLGKISLLAFIGASSPTPMLLAL